MQEALEDATSINYVAQIQETCQRHHWPLPRYADDAPSLDKDFPFAMAVVIDVPNRHALSATGAHAANKKKARQEAAHAMLCNPDLQQVCMCVTMKVVTHTCIIVRFCEETRPFVASSGS